MSVPSDGSYGIQEGLIYSYPVVCKNGDYEIVQGLEINDFIAGKMKESEQELQEEADAVKEKT
jgi:malate dehydrogenase